MKLNVVILIMLLLHCSILKSQENQMENDWPDLGRYREENRKIGLPAEGEDRIVFMGNSITEGWGRACPDFFSKKSYINRGISGQTTPQMLLRFRADVIKLKPSVVVILAGINDIAGNTGPSTPEMIQDNLASMAELARAHGISVILCSVLPARDFPWRPGLEPAGKVIEINKWIRSYAQKNGHTYLDFFSAMADTDGGMKSGYSNDEVHPTEAGYRVMGTLAGEAIRKALKDM